MEKEKIDLKKITPEFKTISHKDQIFTIKKYLDVKDREIILNSYADFVNKEMLEKDLVSDADNVLVEKAGVMFAIIDVATNIDAENINEFIDVIISSGLWDVIKYNIANFDAVERDVTDLNNRLKEKRSLIPALIEFLDFIKQTFSDEQIAKMLQELLEAKKELSEVYPQIKKPRKARAKKE